MGQTNKAEVKLLKASEPGGWPTSVGEAPLTTVRIQGPQDSKQSRALCRKKCHQTVSQICPKLAPCAFQPHWQAVAVILLLSPDKKKCCSCLTSGRISEQEQRLQSFMQQLWGRHGNRLNELTFGQRAAGNLPSICMMNSARGTCTCNWLKE